MEYQLMTLKEVYQMLATLEELGLTRKFGDIYSYLIEADIEE